MPEFGFIYFSLHFFIRFHATPAIHVAASFYKKKQNSIKLEKTDFSVFLLTDQREEVMTGW